MSGWETAVDVHYQSSCKFIKNINVPMALIPLSGFFACTKISHPLSKLTLPAMFWVLSFKPVLLPVIGILLTRALTHRGVIPKDALVERDYLDSPRAASSPLFCKALDEDTHYVELLWTRLGNDKILQTLDSQEDAPEIDDALETDTSQIFKPFLAKIPRSDEPEEDCVFAPVICIDHALPNVPEIFHTLQLHGGMNLSQEIMQEDRLAHYGSVFLYLPEGPEIDDTFPLSQVFQEPPALTLQIAMNWTECQKSLIREEHPPNSSRLRLEYDKPILDLPMSYSTTAQETILSSRMIELYKSWLKLAEHESGDAWDRKYIVKPNFTHGEGMESGTVTACTTELLRRSVKVLR
ncbi:hypothetical protein F5146DRAFT_1116175 [Armillaria mellea]|nr:hypothetical protein F5146DRAFT_1116175 [Armillaria mellea]